jgi:hypothetical protein
MSVLDAMNHTERPKEYRVVIQRAATEVMTIGCEEAATIEEAQELAHNRAEGALCHMCAKHLSLSDPGDDLVEIVDQDGEVTTIDYEAQDLDARLKAMRNATLDEVADALAHISTGELNGAVRGKLREVAVKLRGHKLLPGKVDLT